MNIVVVLGQNELGLREACCSFKFGLIDASEGDYANAIAKLITPLSSSASPPLRALAMAVVDGTKHIRFAFTLKMPIPTAVHISLFGARALMYST